MDLSYTIRKIGTPVAVVGQLAVTVPAYTQPVETADQHAERLVKASGLNFPEWLSPQGIVRIGRDIALAREGGYLLAQGIFPDDKRIINGIREMDEDGDGTVTDPERVRAEYLPSEILVENKGNIGRKPPRCRIIPSSDFINSRDFQLYQDLQRYRLEDFIQERRTFGLNQYQTSPPEIAAWETKAYESTGDLSVLETKLASLRTRPNVMTRGEYNYFAAKDLFEERRDNLADQRYLLAQARANPGLFNKDLGEWAQEISREEKKLEVAREIYDRFKAEVTDKPTNLTQKDWEWLKLKEKDARQDEYWGALTRDNEVRLASKLSFLEVEMKRCLNVTADF
jgi:hypothetical protein